jgi:hypothetical protein
MKIRKQLPVGAEAADIASPPRLGDAKPAKLGTVKLGTVTI